MAQYTEEFLAIARHGYENTDQPMRELARELGIGITTLSTLAEKNSWAKRSLRQRGLPPAMKLLEEVKALAGVATLPANSREGGNPESEEPGSRFPHETRLALLRGDEGSEHAPAAPDPSALLVQLQQILAQLITAQQLAPANGIHSPQGARTLTLLIQSMRALKGMHGQTSTATGPIDNDDDDMPADIDEFRNELARRIRAFFAGRAGEGNDDAGVEHGGVGARGA